jgi:mono/diheme cytochrome c family protein
MRAMRILCRLAAATLAAALIGLVAPARSQDQAPPGDAGNGKRLYLADGCFACHGRVGQGGQYYGPTPVLAHSELPFDAFEQQLREPANNMPAYAEAVLSEQEVADIYAYLQTLPGRGDAKDLPAILTH